MELINLFHLSVNYKNDKKFIESFLFRCKQPLNIYCDTSPETQDTFLFQVMQDDPKPHARWLGEKLFKPIFICRSHKETISITNFREAQKIQFRGIIR